MNLVTKHLTTTEKVNLVMLYVVLFSVALHGVALAVAIVFSGNVRLVPRSYMLVV
jgi:hypothetical protein